MLFDHSLTLKFQNFPTMCDLMQLVRFCSDSFPFPFAYHLTSQLVIHPLNSLCVYYFLPKVLFFPLSLRQARSHVCASTIPYVKSEHGIHSAELSLSMDV